MSNLAKKFFVVSLVFATVMLNVASVLVPSAHALAAGDLIKGPNSDAVYYIGADMKKYVFPDGKTYFTWYKNFNGVKKVTVSDLDMYPNGGAVTYRPGTKLVKTVDSNKVYAVEPGGTLRWIKDEATAIALWGSNWAKNVNDVIPGYFSATYKVGADLGSMYPTGQLIQKNGDSTIYYVDGSTIRPFASGDAFTVNGFDYAFIVKVANTTGYTTGSSITGQESALSSINASSSVPAVAGALTVSLAADTPASGVVVANVSRVPFTKVNLTTGNNPVTIDTIVVKRGGIGQDAAFSTVDILDGKTMLPFDPNSKSFNSNHEANFTKDITIPANTTWPIYLAGNMNSSLASYAGEFPALGISSISLTAGSSLSGSLPIMGNTQTLNGTITVGTATVQRGAYTNASTTSMEVGKTNYTFFSFQVQAGSVEDMNLTNLSVYQEGTATLGTDLVNAKLLKDGTKIADGTFSDKYINFTLATPLKIEKGQTAQFQVQADVANGSGRTIKLEFYRGSDLVINGLTYGYNITPSYSGTGYSGSATATPILTDNQFTISTGTLQVERSNTVGSNNITIGNDQVLGAFKFTVKGEPVDISSLTLTITSSTSGTIIEDAIQGVKLVDAAGKTVAGPTDVTNNSNPSTVIFTDTFTAPAGENVYKVVGNLATNGGWGTNDTIYAGINTPGSKITARGQVTGNTVTATPSTEVTTNTQTVKGAYLTATRNTLPATKSVIKGAQDVVLASWNLDATNSGEDIRITSMSWFASSSGANNLTIYDGKYGSGGVAKSPVNDAPTMYSNDPRIWTSSTFAFDTPIIVTKGTSKTIELVGDIKTGATIGDQSTFGLTDSATSNNASIVAYGVKTGNRAYTALTADQGPVMTYAGAGSVTVSANNSNVAKALVRAGGTGVTLGYVKIDASNEALDLDTLKVFMKNESSINGTAAGDYQDIATVYLYDGSTLLGSASIPSSRVYTFNFPNGTLTVPKDGSKTLTIKADISTINKDTDNAPGTPGVSIRVGLGGKTGFQFTGNDSNTTIGSSSETYNGSTTTSMVVHKAVPSVVYSQSGATLGAVTALTNGSQDLYKFKVSADASGNQVLLYRVSFEIATGATSQNVTVTSCFLKDDTNGNQVISHSTGLTPTDIDGTTKNLISFTFNDPNNSSGASSAYKEALDITAGTSRQFTLNCTVGAAATGSYVSVSLLGDTASSTSADGYGNPSTNSIDNQADQFHAYDQGNFVWSDNYKERGLATDGANATAWGQWYNGYLVSGLGELTTTTAYTVAWNG